MAWGASPWLALALPSLGGVAASGLGNSKWRRLMIGAGFPLSLALSGAASVPAWAWLLPLGLLLLVYPVLVVGSVSLIEHDVSSMLDKPLDARMNFAMDPMFSDISPC